MRPGKPSRGGGKRSQPEGSTTHVAIERTAMKPKDFTCRVPTSIVVEVCINGHPMRALLDTGLMADFLLTTAVDQLRLKKEVLVKPLPVQLAVHGSRSKINCAVEAQFQYQDIDCKKRFDVVNLDDCDLILGTPFLFQHRVMLGMNPTWVAIGSAKLLEILGEEVISISVAVTDLLEGALNDLREQLKCEASDLCLDAMETGLPPLRAVNHTIPLIDEAKVYSWRPSKCLEAYRSLWQKKCNTYLDSGRWQVATGVNAMLLLIIPKP
ncbi:hypothetical protein PAXINDRAFT_87886, partial [Paxillus involutus ATCC 200175]